MLFGTYAVAPGEVSALERATAEGMMDLLVAFVSDPENGLSDRGWPVYDTGAEDGGTLARFGADGEVVRYVSGNEASAEGACYVPGVALVTTP